MVSTMDPKPADKESTPSATITEPVESEEVTCDTVKANGFSIDDYALQYAATRGISPGAPSRTRCTESSYSSNEDDEYSSNNGDVYENDNSPQNIIAAYNRRASKTAASRIKGKGGSKPLHEVVAKTESHSSSSEEEEDQYEEEDYVNNTRRSYPGAKEEEESYREEEESDANSSEVEEEEDAESYDADNYPLANIPSPGKHDVLFGRGGATNHHAGNKLFRTWVEAKKDYYLNAKRNEKTEIAMEIVESWRDLTPPGRFLIKDGRTDLYNDAGDDMARKKTAATLRETRCNNSAKVEAYTDIEYVPPPGPRRGASSGGSGGGRRATNTSGSSGNNHKRSRTSSGRNLPRREDRGSSGSRSRSPMPPLPSVSVTTKARKRKSGSSSGGGGDWEDDYCLEYAEAVSRKNTVKMKYGRG